MALTRSFKETVQARVLADRSFREALLREAIDTMLAGDIDVGKAILRDYLAMVADTHHRRVAADDTINFDALYPQPDRLRPDGQLPGQLSIDDILGGTVDPAEQGEATG